ncbi:MAG: hypothetical protein IJF23_04780 [Clostridia bacterium]|nr:hypothetical protein [Clostridia bacterium]
MEQNTQLWLFPKANTPTVTLSAGESMAFSFIECFDGKFSYEVWLRCKTERNVKLGLYVNAKTIYEKMVIAPTEDVCWTQFGCFQVVKGEHELIIRNNDDIDFTFEGALVTRDSGYIRCGVADEHRLEIIKGRNIDDVFAESGMKFSEEEPDDVRRDRIEMLMKQGFVERPDQDAAENRCRNGVPLGGVGTGKVELDSDGVFTGITVNNNFDVPLYKTDGSFFAVKCGDHARILQKVNYNGFPFPTVENIDFKGVFPTADLVFTDNDIPVGLSLKAYSFLPNNDVKNCAIPAAVFDFTVENPTDKEQQISLMFSWENLLGTGGSMGLKSKDEGNSSFVMNTWNPGFTWSDRTGTYQKKNAENSITFGIDSTSENLMSIGDYTILCTDRNCRAKKSWKVCDGKELWNEFLSGKFTETDYVGTETGYGYIAGAICSDFTLLCGEKRTVTFILAWNMPNYFDYQGNNIGVYYSNFFSSSKQVAEYAAENKDRLLAATSEIKNAVFSSSLPEWLKGKLINDMFPIVTCSWFDKSGHFSINEAPTGMMGCLGTMDQRLACNGIYTNFFKDLDRVEMRLFALNQGENGSISHDVGFGVFNETPRGGSWSDLCSSFIIQVYKDYTYNGEYAYLEEMYERCKNAVKYQLSTDRDDDGIPDVGSGLGTTYDTYHWYGASSFVASLWLAELRCCEKMAEDMNDLAFAEDCRKKFIRAQKSAIEKLWCEKYPYGNYFISYNDVPNAKVSENCFIAQLAGAWAAKLLGLGDIFPKEMINQAIRTIYERNVTLNNMKLMNDETTPEDDRDGYGYTFIQYDEVYFGCLAIYYGFIDEGLDVFRRVYDATVGSPWNIVLTHFADGNRTGLPYYMTNPASFFIIEALSGFVPNLVSGSLRINPNINENSLNLPLFSPKLWLDLDYEKSEYGEKFDLSVLRAEENVCFKNFTTECEKKVGSVFVDGQAVSFEQNGTIVSSDVLLDFCKNKNFTITVNYESEK